MRLFDAGRALKSITGSYAGWQKVMPTCSAARCSLGENGLAVVAVPVVFAPRDPIPRLGPVPLALPRAEYLLRWLHDHLPRERRL